MRILINGQEEELFVSSVEKLVESLQLVPEKIVIEHNNKILKTEEWGRTKIKENDKIEIVSFVGGG